MTAPPSPTAPPTEARRTVPRRTFVRWRELPAAERARLGDLVAALLPRVFAGLRPADVERIVGNLERVQLLWSAEGALVGMNSVRFVEVKPLGFSCPVWVMNHIAGMLPEYRGGNAVVRLVLWECCRHWLTHAFQTFYYCCCIIHPSSYRIFAKFGSRPYPSLGEPRSTTMDALVGAIGAALGYPLERGEEGHWVARLGFHVAAEKSGMESYLRSDAITQYFVRLCPQYREGLGLMVVTPLGIRAAIEGPLCVAFDALVRFGRRRREARAAATTTSASTA